MLQLLSQEDDRPLVNKPEPSEWPGFCFDAAAARRTRSNDKLRLMRDVLETWTQHLRDRCVPGLFKMFDKQLHSKHVPHLSYLHLQSQDNMEYKVGFAD